jgi:drug/metabolite transporter (DMT)-like permease
MLTALRAAPTAVVLALAWPVLRYSMPRGRAAWTGTVVTGLLMVGVFLAGFTEAIVRAGPGNAIVLASTAPFFVAVLSRILFGERVSLSTAVGLVVGFVGVILIVSSQLGSGGNDVVVGMMLALAAALGWAAGTLVVKDMFSKDGGVDLVGLTTWQYVVGGAVLLVVAFVSEGTGGTDWGSGDLWLSVAFISIVGSAIATLTYFGALRHLSATRTTAWTFLSPVVAVLLEIVLGHTPRAIVLVGMAVTIAGVAIVNALPQAARES